MKVGIVLFGSRGDIQPYAALAHGLTAAGHEVVIAANADAAPIVDAVGVRFVPITELDIRKWLSSPVGQEALMAGTAQALLDSANAWIVSALPSLVAATKEVADGADVVISGFPMDDYVAAVCAAQGVPMILGYLTPWLPTKEFPPAYMRVGRPDPELLSGEDNLRTYQEFEEIFWRGRREAVTGLRASLGLAPADRPLLQTAPDLGYTVLHAYSPVVVPPPQDWGRGNVFTGYWRLPASAREQLGEAVPPAALVEWLDAGTPPIYLGFGSMPIMDPAPVLRMAAAAAERAGVRILIGAGWTDMTEAAAGLPDHVAVVNEVDHDWLFPRCAAVVHHGGAGTVAAGLTAGRPSFVFSMFFDQPYWGAQIARLHAGGGRMLTEMDLDTLIEAMVLLADRDVRGHAAEIGDRLRQEDGVAAAIKVITDPSRAVVPR